MKQTEFSPAKINLNLHILGRRRDGYHELFSLVCFADYGDKVVFEPGGQEDQLIVSGHFADKIKGENSILQAAKLLREKVLHLPYGMFSLEKNLPVSSGMGGGSANAAAALRLLFSYTPASFSKEDKTALALQLGADVPVCLQGQSVYMSGIGEKIEPFIQSQPFYAVLVNPLVPVSTGDIFTRLQAAALKDAPMEKIEALKCEPAGDMTSYLQGTWNDLERPAIKVEPKIARVLEVLKQQNGCFLSRMSGSGATCFGLFHHKAEAELAQKRLTNAAPEWWIKSTVLG